MAHKHARESSRQPPRPPTAPARIARGQVPAGATAELGRQRPSPASPSVGPCPPSPAPPCTEVEGPKDEATGTSPVTDGGRQSWAPGLLLATAAPGRRGLPRGGGGGATPSSLDADYPLRPRRPPLGGGGSALWDQRSRPPRGCPPLPPLPLRQPHPRHLALQSRPREGQPVISAPRVRATDLPRNCRRGRGGLALGWGAGGVRDGRLAGRGGSLRPRIRGVGPPRGFRGGMGGPPPSLRGGGGGRPHRVCHRGGGPLRFGFGGRS